MTKKNNYVDQEDIYRIVKTMTPKLGGRKEISTPFYDLSGVGYVECLIHDQYGQLELNLLCVVWQNGYGITKINCIKQKGQYILNIDSIESDQITNLIEYQYKESPFVCKQILDPDYRQPGIPA